MKKFFRNRWTKRALLFSLVVSMMVCTAFAVGEDTTGTSASMETVKGAFQTGFQQIASDALSIIAVIVPIALGVCGVIFIAKKAMSWFKSMSGG